MPVRMWRQEPLCSACLPCAQQALAWPILWLTDPIPCSLPECGCPWSCALHRQGGGLRALLHSSARPSSPQGGSERLTHPGASCTPVTRCPLLSEWTPAASTPEWPTLRIGPGRGTGAWGLFPGQTAAVLTASSTPAAVHQPQRLILKMFPDFPVQLCGTRIFRGAALDPCRVGRLLGSHEPCHTWPHPQRLKLAEREGSVPTPPPRGCRAGGFCSSLGT